MKNKRLSIIGPLPPLRGGIAKHTDQMIRHIDESVDWEALSPKKLYPDFLYPGRSQYDENLLTNTDNRIKRLSTWVILMKLLFRAQKGPILVIWWTSFLAPMTLTVKLIAKIKRREFTVFCHNVLPHDSKSIDRLLAKIVMLRARHCIVQSPTEQKVLRGIGYEGSISVLPHPLMDVSLPEPRRAISDATKNQHTFLFIGLIREYKNVPFLISTFRGFDCEDSELRVVGEPWSTNLDLEIKKLVSQDPRVKYIDSYVSEESFLEEIMMSDTVVLPYTKVTGSQIMASAIAAGKNLILSDIDGFRDNPLNAEMAYFFELDDSNSLIEAMNEAKDGSSKLGFSNNEGVSWEEFGAKFSDLFRGFLGPGRP